LGNVSLSDQGGLAGEFNFFAGGFRFLPRTRVVDGNIKAKTGERESCFSTNARSATGDPCYSRLFLHKLRRPLPCSVP
jgi:hypothetical protein